jgi:predicted dehydrogenase
MDLVEVLVPTPLRCDVACAVLEAGYHVNLQKPIARTMDEVDRILAARNKSGATLRIMEDYLFFEPLVRLKEITESGEIGRPAGLHMKMVATGRGAWDTSPSSWAWQLQQMRDGLPLLMFDDGWHKFAVAHWLFGPINRMWAWAGRSRFD